MNILILNWRDSKNKKSGGAEKLNMHILKPLLDRGDTVTWYAQAVTDLAADETYKGVNIIRKGNSFTHYLFWPFLLWTGKFGKVDFIIDCIHGTGYLSAVFAPRTPRRVLICEVAKNIWDDMYTFPINKIGKIWEKIMLFFYFQSIFWTISESTKKDLTLYGVNKSKIVILPMGFDSIADLAEPTKWVKPTALFVGRLAEMKGVADAIKAISEVNAARSDQWQLRIVGRGDAVYEAKLKKLVTRVKAGRYVSFLGFKEEKDKFIEMSRAWVLLVPSSREGWGMIVPEANFAGTPVIGYDVAGLKDSMKLYSKKNILIKPGYKELAKQLLAMNKPSTVKDKPIPGWNSLYTYVLSDL